METTTNNELFSWELLDDLEIINRLNKARLEAFILYMEAWGQLLQNVALFLFIIALIKFLQN